MNLQQPKYSPSETLDRIKIWCDIQERAQQEVRDKLYKWGLHQDQVESIIADLISENYLNEERFARAYVSGKFRIKRWGRNKIVSALKFKKISGACVRLGLQEIDEQEYEQAILHLIKKKAPRTKAGSAYELKHKTAAYLVQRGYEPDLIWPYIEDYFQD